MSNQNERDISITFMSGPFDGKTMNFTQPKTGKQKIFTIGRREGCDIHLPFDNQVSRLHARIGCDSKIATTSDAHDIPPILSFWIEDGGSRNGTFIEYDPEPIAKRITLRPGTLFRIGRTWLRLDVPLSFGI
jgi:pSer/pThr/pTyr-binding forkhead associated (FHA) protein